jgi:hypothetical protein
VASRTPGLRRGVGYNRRRFHKQQAASRPPQRKADQQRDAGGSEKEAEARTLRESRHLRRQTERI